MNKRFIKGTVAVAAVLSICIFTVSNTATADSIKGFFKDVVRWDGAVVGTEYVQATEEVDIHVLEATRENDTVALPIEIIFVNKDIAPFIYIEEVALGKYEIVDENGHDIGVIVSSEGENTEGENAIGESATGVVNNGKVLVDLQVTGEQMLAGNEYILIIESIYGSSKGDGPIEIKGNWECKFEIQ